MTWNVPKTRETTKKTRVLITIQMMLAADLNTASIYIILMKKQRVGMTSHPLQRCSFCQSENSRHYLLYFFTVYLHYDHAFQWGATALNKRCKVRWCLDTLLGAIHHSPSQAWKQESAVAGWRLWHWICEQDEGAGVRTSFFKIKHL